MKQDVLSEIKAYCKGKRIIIVGNSSAILKSDKGRFIDSHDIVVRMNYAYPVKNIHVNSLGRKTDIYMAGISRTRMVEHLLSKNQLKYILRLTPWSDPLKGNNVYHATKLEYNILKKSFGEFKPSSGSLTIDFFLKNIDYQLLNIIGFDFFKTSDRFRKNEFKSYLYKDHNSQCESQYIIKCLNTNTKLIKA